MITIKDKFKQKYGTKEVKLPYNILTIKDNYPDPFSSGSNGYLTKVRIGNNDDFELYHDWWSYGWLTIEQLKEKYPNVICHIKSVINRLL